MNPKPSLFGLSLVAVVFLLDSGLTTEASAVKKCEIKAEVIAIGVEKDGKRLVKVKELSAKFIDGHSMGKDCAAKKPIYSIELPASAAAKLKQGSRILLERFEVSGLGPEGKLYHTVEWSLKGGAKE